MPNGSESAQRVVTLTVNPALDISMEIGQLAPSRKLRARITHRDPGGGGINVARAVHILGGRSLALWARGGCAGDEIGRWLDDEDVDHHSIQVEGESRECVIVTDAAGDQYRFIPAGPELRTDEVEALLSAPTSVLEDGAVLVLSGSLPPGAGGDFYARAIRQARDSVRVVLDASGTSLRQGVRAAPFLVKPNVRELGELVGTEISSDAEISQAASDLIDRHGVAAVVVSLGAGGSILVTESQRREIRSPTVPIVSRVGAGDSMVAGIALGLARGWSVGEAVRLGTACGAAAVMTPGTHLCRRDDAWRLHDEMDDAEAGATESAGGPV